jgi:hypothetical protein
MPPVINKIALYEISKKERPKRCSDGNISNSFYFFNMGVQDFILIY